jgi:hypothetical protein
MPCPTCGGRKTRVHPEHFRALYLEMKTPAFRSRPSVRDDLAAEYRTADAVSRPKTVTEFRIVRVDLVDDRHGLLHVSENGEPSASAQRWIRAPERGTDAWFLHDARTDGPWPGDDLPVGPTGVPAFGSTAPLEALQHADLDATAAALGARSFRIAEARRAEKTLVLVLRPREGLGHDAARDAAPLEAARLAREILRSLPDWDAVHSTWRANWRHVSGKVEERPFAVAWIDRRALAGVEWASLPDARKPEVLRWERPSHEGWSPAP